MQLRDSTEAFEKAITSGRLSDQQQLPTYAGRFMYMGTTDSGRDLFKNIDTREYLD